MISTSQRLVYSGSFAPLHYQHVYNMLYCEDLFPKLGECVFEISDINCRKGFVDPIEIEIRSQAIKSIGRQVLKTSASSFCEKFTIFNNSYFIVGSDTFEYLIDVNKCWFNFPRLLEDFFKHKRHGNSFIVLPRGKLSNNKTEEEWNQLIDYTRQLLKYWDVCQDVVGFVNFHTYMQNSISSTSIRNDSSKGKE